MPSWSRGISAAPARIAYHYLRDAAEADEAVQDAFVKAYQHLASFREELPFDVWFTRILINGCLDRIKARTRRERWLVPMTATSAGGADGATVERDFGDRVASGGPSPEQRCSSRERRREIAEALARLPERQRAVFVLSHVEGHTSREVSAMTGLNESTVRVHLFRAIRKLRTLLAPDRHRRARGSSERKTPCHFLNASDADISTRVSSPVCGRPARSIRI